MLVHANGALDSSKQVETVLAQDSRVVHMLACSHGGEALPGDDSTGVKDSSSCCLAHGFVPKADPEGLSFFDAGSHGHGEGRERVRVKTDDSTAGGAAAAGGRVATPRLAHFVFDVKGPPPRCSYFFFVAVRAAVRVLGADMGADGGVVVHFHYEPWGPWWAAIKALPHVRTVTCSE